MKVRTYTAPEDAKPAVGLLSNGSYTVMVTASVTFTTAVADSRQAALALAGKYHAASVFERAVSQASTRAQAELRRLQAGYRRRAPFPTPRRTLDLFAPGAAPAPAGVRQTSN